MNTRIFRSESLEQLSSPEQLDELLHITSARYWLGLLAIILLLGTATVWGVRGIVTSTAEGEGVIVRRGGVLNVVSQGGGLVLNLNVRVGEKISADQLVARVAQPELVEKRRATQLQLAEALHEKDQQFQVRQRSADLQIQTLDRERANTEHEILELQDQANVVREQIATEDGLLSKGLLTKRQILVDQEKLIGIEDRVSNDQALLKRNDAQQFALRSRPEQETIDQRLRISNLQRQIEELNKQLTLTENVISPFAGEIVEVKSAPGAMVNVGEPIISIQPSSQALDLIAYVPSAKAKQAKAGMSVHVSPSTVKREEFGFINGRVQYVSDYPATSASVQRNFANESLTQVLVNSGPVTEVWIALNHDANSFSGLQWSGLRSPDILVTSGTLCSVEIVTRRQRPVSLLLPILKEMSGID
jgi:HlyD family secretion protein